MSWEPERYLKYGSLRLRPALDLLMRVRHDSPRRVVDLGCGPGTVTTVLAERWPDAEIIGVDSAAEMLARAAAAYPRLMWVDADIAHWRTDVPADVIFSNAALHWLDDHEGASRQIWLQPGRLRFRCRPTSMRRRIAAFAHLLTGRNGRRALPARVWGR